MCFLPIVIKGPLFSANSSKILWWLRAWLRPTQFFPLTKGCGFQEPSWVVKFFLVTLQVRPSPYHCCCSDVSNHQALCSVRAYAQKNPFLSHKTTVHKRKSHQPDCHFRRSPLPKYFLYLIWPSRDFTKHNIQRQPWDHGKSHERSKFGMKSPRSLMILIWLDGNQLINLHRSATPRPMIVHKHHTQNLAFQWKFSFGFWSS